MAQLPFLSIAVIIALLQTVCCVPLSEFFPFGLNNGDAILPRMTDGTSFPIQLHVPFPFFDRLEHTILVDVHGTLVFEGISSAHHTPDCLPTKSSNRMVAAFWADSVTHNGTGGEISFRQERKPQLLRKAAAEIVNQFPSMTGLRLKWLFISTWHNVTFYGAEGCYHEFNQYPRNTFQVTLATDGTVSFVIFYYKSIVWTTSRYETNSGNCSGLGGRPARVGFDPGDRKNFYSLPESCTDDIVKVDEKTNSDAPGKWLFRVDNSHSITMTSNCNENSTLSAVGGKPLRILPSFVDTFGGPITLHGPCFDVHRVVKATCIFHDPVLKDTVVVKGRVFNNSKQAVPAGECIVPLIQDTGRIRVDLQIVSDNNETYLFSGHLSIVKKVPQVLVNFIKDGSEAEVIWNHHSHSVYNSFFVDIHLYRRNKTSLPPAWRHEGILAEEIVNSGNFTLDSTRLLSDDLSIISVSASVAYLKRKRRSLDEFKDLNFAMMNFHDERFNAVFNEMYKESQISDFVRKVDLKTTAEKQEACLRWYENSPGLRLTLRPCPPTLALVRLDQNFKQDTCAHSLVKEHCLHKYHPGAFDSYVSALPNREGHGQQCTYDKAGNLLIGPPGGGTADFASPQGFFGETEHMDLDVVPWVACCSEGDLDLCRKYYEKRPSDDGTRYRRPWSGLAVGDPHITTIDQLHYTFNGLGEFWMIKPITTDNSSSDEKMKMQARMEKFITNSINNNTDGSVNASVFTAFAIQQGDSGIVVQLQLSQSSEDRVLDVLVDGEPLPFDSPVLLSQNFDNVSIRAVSANLTDVLVSFSNGFNFRFLSTRAAMSIMTSATRSSSEEDFQFHGLLGNFDGNPLNDLSKPDGTIIDSKHTANLSMIHYNFGMKWLVTDEESIFTYGEGKNTTYFQDKTFTPVFELPDKFQAELPPHIAETCAGSRSCVFDYLVTGGDEEIALQTAKVEKIVIDVEVIISEKAPTLCSTIKAPANGFMMSTTNGISFYDGVSVRFDCNDGYYTNETTTITCANGTWTSRPPSCNKVDNDITIMFLPDLTEEAFSLRIVIIVLSALIVLLVISLIMGFLKWRYHQNRTQTYSFRVVKDGKVDELQPLGTSMRPLL